MRQLQQLIDELSLLGPEQSFRVAVVDSAHDDCDFESPFIMAASEVNDGGAGVQEEILLSEEQKTVIASASVAAAPIEALAAGVTGSPEQHRGLKRSRRDRGSTAKDRISKMPPCVAGKRSSIYRGVTRHRWTGRYEAHLWDKSTWNQTQNKKGKQVYLGAYDEEEAAARAYDLAALKYWGPGTLINFPVSDYTRDIKEMQSLTREEYLASLRRKSSGFSRGVSKYRGVARHHHNGRWEARIGRVFGNKYLYLGTYSTQEEAAAAYDMAAIEYRGMSAVTNFDLSRYIRWLRPPGDSSHPEPESNLSPGVTGDELQSFPGLGDEQYQSPTPVSIAGRVVVGPGILDDEDEAQGSSPVWPGQLTEPYRLPALGGTSQQSSSSPTALSLLLQSTMFKQMMERASIAATSSGLNDCDSTTPSSDVTAIDSAQNHLYVSSAFHQPQQQHQDLHNHLSDHFFPSHHYYDAPPLVDEESPEHQDVSSLFFCGNDTTSSSHQQQQQQEVHNMGMFGELSQQEHLSAAYVPFLKGEPSPFVTESENLNETLDDGGAYWSFGSGLPLNPSALTAD
ncbi:hypothetical protein R1flu_024529 [Riccia fluitans]|uniref:AP2/ERF domain-containing protein n=1 Tax=Riccia fluitans TaxID=41844 RepID=A0ABD1XVB2_9MARC